MVSVEFNSLLQRIVKKDWIVANNSDDLPLSI